MTDRRDELETTSDESHVRIIVRQFEQQFEAESRERIQALLDGFDDFLAIAPDYRYQVRELQSCLTTGLLLAALHVASSVFERFLRDVLIARELRERSGPYLPGMSSQLRDEVTHELERDRKRAGHLGQLADTLRGHPLDEKDALLIRRFYEYVRVPLLYGLLGRFVSAPPIEPDNAESPWPADVPAPCDFMPQSFGDAIEDRALNALTFALDIMRAYQLHLPDTGL